VTTEFSEKRIFIQGFKYFKYKKMASYVALAVNDFCDLPFLLDTMRPVYQI